jgi:hypothetical protein
MNRISELAQYSVVTQLFSNGLNLLATTVHDEEDGKKWKVGMNKNEGQEGIPLSESPFNYAISYWLKHAMDVPQGCGGTSISRELWELVKDFFWDQDGDLFTEWLRVLAPKDDDWNAAGKHVRCLSPFSDKSGVGSCIAVAASYRLIDTIEWAHPDGIDFDVPNKIGVTPLIYAAWCEEEGAVKALLSKNSMRINQKACYLSDTGQCPDGDCGSTGTTPLIAAAMNKPSNVLRLLLKQPGIEVDLVSHGYTALGQAINDNIQEAIELLVGAGAKTAMYGGKIVDIPSRP